MSPFVLRWWRAILALALAAGVNVLFYSAATWHLRELIVQQIPEPDAAAVGLHCQELARAESSNSMDQISELRTMLVKARKEDGRVGVKQRWLAISKTLYCWGRFEKNGAPPGEPWKPRVGVGTAAPTHIRVKSASEECLYPAFSADGGLDVTLHWFPPQCLLNHIVGIETPRQAGFLLVLPPTWEATVSRGLEGAVYQFNERRKSTPSDARQGNSPAVSLNVARDALTEIDRTLMPVVADLQDSRSIFVPRFLLRAIHHPFQWVMFLIGWWCLILILWRWGRARRLRFTTPMAVEEADRLRRRSVESAALIDSLTEAIPSMGFIGTVVGMILAMAGIGAVLAADQGPEMYAAMAQVTASLSLAFNTTFVGLVIAIPISYLKRVAAAAESLKIDSPTATDESP
jgi:hypothetical protein